MNPVSGDDSSAQSDAPAVSVVITTFNRQELLPRAVRSVLSQTYTDFELIIVDDHSTDSTGSVVRDFEDPRIRYVRLEKNSGLSASRNTGIHIARGQYVAFLDDDDEWKPEKLEKQVALANESPPEYGVFHCGADKVDAMGQLIGQSFPSGRGNVREDLVQRNLVTISSTYLFRNDALDRIGGFDENLASHVDYDIWMKIAQAELHSDYVDESLVILRYDNRTQMTSDVRPRIEATQVYLDKWDADIKQWFGEEEGRKYIVDIRTRIMLKLASSALERRNISGVAQCAWHTFRNHPTDPSVYLRFARLIAENGARATRIYYPLKRIKDTVIGTR